MEYRYDHNSLCITLSLCRKYPHMCKFLGTIPSDQLQYAKVPFWKNIQIPLSKHSWELQIIAIWNTKGRVCLNAHNKQWLKKLAKEIPEAKWEIQNIHNHPYQTALGSGQHSGLNKLISYPMTTLKPQKAQIKQLPWLALTNLIIIIWMKHPKTAPAKT